MILYGMYTTIEIAVPSFGFARNNYYIFLKFDILYLFENPESKLKCI